MSGATRVIFANEVENFQFNQNQRLELLLAS